MKSNDVKALHQKNISELAAQLDEIQTELMQAKLARAASKLEDTSKPERLAKDIARVKTILHQKRLQEEAKKLAKAQEKAAAKEE